MQTIGHNAGIQRRLQSIVYHAGTRLGFCRSSCTTRGLSLRSYTSSSCTRGLSRRSSVTRAFTCLVHRASRGDSHFDRVERGRFRVHGHTCFAFRHWHPSHSSILRPATTYTTGSRAHHKLHSATTAPRQHLVLRGSVSESDYITYEGVATPRHGVVSVLICCLYPR